MKYPKIKPATREDIEQFFPEDLSGYTFMAYAAVLDGAVLGIAGIQYIGKDVLAFSRAAPGQLEKYPRTGAKMAILVKRLLKGRTATAVADGSMEGAGSLLTRLGFTHLQEGVYIWDQQQKD